MQKAKKLILVALLLITLTSCATMDIVDDILWGVAIIGTWELCEYGYEQGYVEQEIEGEVGE